jgi:hypothetical protein
MVGVGLSGFHNRLPGCRAREFLTFSGYAPHFRDQAARVINFGRARESRVSGRRSPGLFEC